MGTVVCVVQDPEMSLHDGLGVCETHGMESSEEDVS
jgi:hypothetical protein